MPGANNPSTSDISDRRNGKPRRRETTPPQVFVSQMGLIRPELPKVYPDGWYRLVRKMRIDPTIALIRELVISPILASEWSIGHTVKAPTGAVEFIQENIFDERRYILEHALNGILDFGWQAFEKVWTINDKSEAVIDKIKPLLQDITRILVNKHNGEYIGTIQSQYLLHDYVAQKVGEDVVFGVAPLKAHETILCNTQVEGTNWYGRALMLNEQLPYRGWNTVNDSADRYDRKIAGTHWVIQYPLGQSTLDGETVDNSIVAQRIIDQLESSGVIIVPREIDQTLQELNSVNPNAWDIQLLSDQSSQQSNFIDRLAYYDALKARALGWPERSVFQGKFGTKAEAKTHSDLAIVILDGRHAALTEQISYQLVNDLMKYNYGRESIGTVFLKPAPIADDLRKFLRDIFLRLLQSDPKAALERVNAQEIRERLGLPLNTDESDESGFKFQEPQAPQGGTTGAFGNPQRANSSGERNQP
jgi:hypothetical protein